MLVLHFRTRKTERQWKTTVGKNLNFLIIKSIESIVVNKLMNALSYDRGNWSTIVLYPEKV